MLLSLTVATVSFAGPGSRARATRTVVRADTYTYDTFLGWSEDGSYYGRTSAGRDGVERAEICRSDDANENTGTWPDWLLRPRRLACTPLCARGRDCRKAMERADELLLVPESSRLGPNEEDVKVRADGKRAHVTVECRGEVIAKKSIALHGPIAADDLLGVTWRLDGGAVAVFIPTPTPPDYQVVEAPEPAVYLVVLSVPPACRQGQAADSYSTRF